jgi:hypothetical protein
MAADADGKGWRIPFTVSYSRRGDSNTWGSETTRGKPVRGATAEGAINYRPGVWLEDANRMVSQASVDVLLDPSHPEVDWDAAPQSNSVWPILTKQAQALADSRFRADHIDAEIERVN